MGGAIGCGCGGACGNAACAIGAPRARERPAVVVRARGAPGRVASSGTGAVGIQRSRVTYRPAGATPDKDADPSGYQGYLDSIAGTYSQQTANATGTGYGGLVTAISDVTRSALDYAGTRANLDYQAAKDAAEAQAAQLAAQQQAAGQPTTGAGLGPDVGAPAPAASDNTVLYVGAGIAAATALGLAMSSKGRR